MRAYLLSVFSFLLAFVVIGPVYANDQFDPSSISWSGEVTEGTIGIAGMEQRLKPSRSMTHTPTSNSPSRSTSSSSSNSSSGASVMRQVFPGDPSAPHLANSGNDEVSFLDAMDPVAPAPGPAPAAAAPAQIDPASLVSISDVQRLVAEAGSVSISPGRGWVYVNKPVYFSTDAVAHDRALNILGFPVTVHLVPNEYLWSPGDGSPPISSKGPGGSWPDGDVSHVYRKAVAGVQVELTIEWSASFTVQGTTYPVPGTTTTSSSSTPFEIREAEAVLVH